MVKRIINLNEMFGRDVIEVCQTPEGLCIYEEGESHHIYGPELLFINAFEMNDIEYQEDNYDILYVPVFEITDSDTTTIECTREVCEDNEIVHTEEIIVEIKYKITAKQGY